MVFTTRFSGGKGGRNGGRSAERAFVQSPGGVPGRLNGSPAKLRYVWPDAARLARSA